MKLVDVESGQKVHIIDIQGGRGVGAKLRKLSLMPGDCITVLKRAPLRGPILVENNDRSVALGRGVATMVEVEPCE